MVAYCLDTSAFAKVYFQEKGHLWVRNIVAQNRQTSLFLSTLTTIEIMSVVARHQREGQLTLQQQNLLVRDILNDIERYALITLTDDIRYLARHLLLKHPLRTLDSIQLSSALIAHRITPIRFLSADARLLQIAALEGLPADNPEAYP